jgi:hypothetical protein
MAEEWGLREEFRAAWSDDRFGPLIWVEHARGGTVGAPDVLVPCGPGRGYIPVELKWWQVVPAGGVKMTARPAQRRFHLLAAKQKQETAFLAKLSDGRYAMLPGAKFLGERLDECVAAMFWLRCVRLGEVRATLLDETFWSNNYARTTLWS